MEIKKNTYRWEACNLRVVTGLGWASSVWLRAGTADRQRKSQTTKARSTGEILALPNRRNTYTVPLVRGRAVDKLGMMRCVVCQAGPFRFLPSPAQAPRHNAASCGSQRGRDRIQRRCRASHIELHSYSDLSQTYSAFTRHVSRANSCLYHVTAKANSHAPKNYAEWALIRARMLAPCVTVTPCGMQGSWLLLAIKD